MAERDIAAIVAQADLPTIVASFTSVKKRGSEYVCRCVFHSPDNTPSLSLYHKNGKWNFKCFVCEEAGDAIDWIEKLEGIDTAAAIKRLNGGSEWQVRAKIPHETSLPDRITSKPPADAPTPNFRTYELGEPTHTYAIKDLDGSLLAYECRYETEGKKEFRIWSWGTRGNFPPRWGVGHCNIPRPLYGLDRLAVSPKSAVLVTEGPKKADAGARLLPSYASVSWTAGAHSWHKHDWSVLAGRLVLVWPDNDEPGIAAARKLADSLADPRGLACRVRIVDPTGQPEGWDIADWTGTTDELIAWAKPRAKNHLHIVERQHPHPEPQEPAPSPPLEAYTEDSQRAAEPATQTPRKNGHNALGEVFYRSMVDIESRAISWLWPGRIAKGKVSMIVGNPGLGKSQVCASIASVVSNGGAWPVGRERCEAGSVVILSAEDDPEDTIKPRLEAAGANLAKIFILDAIRVERQEGDGKRGFDLSVDIAKLGALLYELQDTALVIIDPITAYLGEADSHKNAEVRALLAPLGEMASAQGVAVIAVSHLTKSSGMDALLRVQGSIGFAAAARAVWGVAKDKDNPARRLFMPLKNNVGTDNTGFAYSVEGVRLQDTDIDTSHVMWENHLVTQSADDVFGASEQTHDEREHILDAKMYLRSLLADGPVAVKLIEADSHGAGHSWATIRRAQKDLRIVPFRDHGIGSKGKWYWRLDQAAV